MSTAGLTPKGGGLGLPLSTLPLVALDLTADERGPRGRAPRRCRPRRRQWLGVGGLPNGARCPLVPAMAVVGIAQITAAHPAGSGCCDDPWALAEYDGKPVATHYVLRGAFALSTPVPVPGRLGLWELPHQVALEVAGRAGEALAGVA